MFLIWETPHFSLTTTLSFFTITTKVHGQGEMAFSFLACMNICTFWASVLHIFFHSNKLNKLDYTISLSTSLKSPFSVNVYGRFQVSTSHLCKFIFKVEQRNFLPPADEHENSLLVSNSAHTSFCTLKVKQPREVTMSQNTFLTGENITCVTSFLWWIPVISVQRPLVFCLIFVSMYDQLGSVVAKSR